MPKLELLVYEPLDGDRFVVVNNSDVGVPLGTVFTTLQSRLAVRDGESFHEEPLADPHSIVLKLTEIDFWRKLVGEVPRGHKAAARFSGEGIADLRQHLSARQEFVYVFVATAPTEA
jgi:hypothetical protein